MAAMPGKRQLTITVVITSFIGHFYIPQENAIACLAPSRLAKVASRAFLVALPYLRRGECARNC